MFYFENILIISPHPDDSEYSCYGVIKKLQAKTTLLVCSTGGDGDQTNVDDRFREVVDFWKDELPEVSIIHKNLLRTNYHEAVKYLDALISENQFDAIFIPPSLDTNQEHRLISDLANSSLRNKGKAVIEYWTPSTTHEWCPNIWLDIDEHIDLKIEKLTSSFKSQKHKSYFQKSYLDLFHQDWQSFKKDIKKCEKYKLISWMCS
jgi:LmbE family N-acetylglucosaminyl deacetylase